MRAFGLTLCLALFACVANAAENFSGSNVDHRIIIGMKASDAAVAKLLPSGWEVAPPTAGPLKGFNVAVNLIDSVSAADREGKAAITFRGAVLAVPVKRTGSQETGAMVVFGLAAADSVPGAYGVYLPASSSIERTVRSESPYNVDAEERWSFKGEGGATIEVQLRYQRGSLIRSKSEAKTYSGAKPDFHRIYKVEQAADVVRSAPSNIDRVSQIAIKASGSQLSGVFDGSEQVVGVVAIPWYSRQVFLPAS